MDLDHATKANAYITAASATSTPNEHHMWTSAAIAAVLLVFVAVIVAVALLAGHYRNRNTTVAVVRRAARQRTNTKKKKPSLKFNAIHTDPAFIFAAPLVWDTDEGGFMIRITIGASPLQLVFDTGSSQISVKGQQCKWTSCSENPVGGGEVCIVQDCPVDAAYQPTGRSIEPGQFGAGTSTTLTYGSQEDTVSHFLDTVLVGKLRNDASLCDVLFGRTPTAARQQHQQALHNIVVHNVSAITGSSTSNLFGFARAPAPGTATTENGEFTLIEQIYGGVKGERTHNWSLLLNNTNGWWLSALPTQCFPPLQYVPMVLPKSFATFVTRFYVLPIQSFAVGPSFDKLKPVRTAEQPRYCVLDTGTTLTYGAPGLGAAMRQSGYVEGAGYVVMTLGSGAQTIKLTYTPEQLVDPEYAGTYLIQADPHNTLDDYYDIFNGEQVLLFGILMMTNKIWNFDMTRQQIGIANL